MSKKIVNPLGFLEQYKSTPMRSLAERRLFEMRLEEEAEAEALENRARFDKPAVPDAQILFDPVRQKAGVAIRGAKFICELPEGYGGPGCELAMLEGNRFVVTQLDKSPLLIDPQTGTTRRL
jgi:hypothetical protein